MARPKTALVVTKVDRRVLDSMAHRARTAPQLARRARIVLACATGLDNTTVAKKLRMSKPTVGRWRQRFIDKGVDGLLDEPRPGAPRTINDTQVEAVVTRTLETTPRGATHWSTRTLAKATGVSPMRVHRIWQAFGLQPHRTKTFKLSPDPLLIDKVRDIVGLYLNPPQHAAVFCVDEKPQIQALDRTAPLLPLRPGQAERRTHDYKRHGTTSLFAALEVKTGHVLGQIRRRHRANRVSRLLDRPRCPGAGRPGRARHHALEGYRKRFSRPAARSPRTGWFDRLARVAQYDFPAALASSVPIDPIITTIPGSIDGRGRAYGFDLFVSRTTATGPMRA